MDFKLTKKEKEIISYLEKRGFKVFDMGYTISVDEDINHYIYFDKGEEDDFKDIVLVENGIIYDKAVRLGFETRHQK